MLIDLFSETSTIRIILVVHLWCSGENPATSFRRPLSYLRKEYLPHAYRIMSRFVLRMLSRDRTRVINKWEGYVDILERFIDLSYLLR